MDENIIEIDFRKFILNIFYLKDNTEKKSLLKQYLSPRECI